MSALSLGDLSTTFMQKLHTRRLKADLQGLTEALASGRKTDLRQATGGSFVMLASLEHQMSALGAYKVAATEARFFADALQTALGNVQDNLETLASKLLQASDLGNKPWIDAAASDARAAFSSVLSSLNANVANQSLLSGTATGSAALADPDTILGDLMTAVAGETTAAGVAAAVNDWFDAAGGGFETVGYLGSDTALAPFRIGQAETVSIEATAADQRVRDVLKGYAMASLIDAGALSTDLTEQAQLMQLSAEKLLTANAGFAHLRGELGAAEAAIDNALARNLAEAGVLEIIRSEIISADPYETAVDLEATTLQLEALYSVTARLSRLSLMEYL